VLLTVSRHNRSDIELGGAGQARGPQPLVAAAARLDQLRLAGEDGLVWTPQFRELETLDCLSERVGGGMAISLFASDLDERQQGRADPGRGSSGSVPDARRGRLRPPPGRSQLPDPPPPRLPAGGGRMSTASAKRPSQGAQFARELSRAVARRGRLDFVYQALSDHWTLILQRLFPVCSVVGPGLADPGHIDLAKVTGILEGGSS
jgi:hypothetical protein